MTEIQSNPSTKSKEVLYSLSGKVIRGRGIGKLVGTPTANIQISFPLAPLPVGVYISTVTWQQHRYASVTNIGNRPTIDTDAQIYIETLILDFHADIYDTYINIDLLEFLRLPQKFPSVSELLEQVYRDCQKAQTFFGLIPDEGNFKTVADTSDLLEYGALRINLQKRSVIIQNVDISLTTKEYELLKLLIEHPGWAYSKEQIYEAIWNEPVNASYHAVENLVCQVRKKLNEFDVENVPKIKTIIGYGYKLLI